MSKQPEGPDRAVAIAEVLAAEWPAGAPLGWENVTVPQFLGALAGWVRDCDDYYRNRGEKRPAGAWTVVCDALRAAAVYE